MLPDQQLRIIAGQAVPASTTIARGTGDWTFVVTGVGTYTVRFRPQFRVVKGIILGSISSNQIVTFANLTGEGVDIVSRLGTTAAALAAGFNFTAYGYGRV